MIACRNPLLAEERAFKRQELLQATELELDKIVAAVQRTKRPLKGAANIGLRVGKVLNRFKMAKHFHLEITDHSFHYQRNEENILAEAALDRVYVIRTSVSHELFDSQETVRAYKNLSVVERAFRCCKTVDLKVRPIYHRLADRVRAHVFLCMLAYYVEWHMRQSLASLLFDHEDLGIEPVQLDSPVAPARRSRTVLRKTGSKRTQDNFPVHSFATLLAYIATIVKNKVKALLPSHQVTFDKITCPTPVQQKALDLLGVNLLV